MSQQLTWLKRFSIEFKQFAMRGNVLDLAIGVIIGAAFSKIVTAAVEDILMPFLGIFLGAINLSDLQLTIGKATFAYGHFLQTTLDFILIAFGIFLIIKAINVVMYQEVSRKQDIQALQLETLKMQTNLLKSIHEELKIKS